MFDSKTTLLRNGLVRKYSSNIDSGVVPEGRVTPEEMKLRQGSLTKLASLHFSFGCKLYCRAILMTGTEISAGMGGATGAAVGEMGGSIDDASAGDGER